jgi:hypothetical protein
MSAFRIKLSGFPNAHQSQDSQQYVLTLSKQGPSWNSVYLEQNKKRRGTEGKKMSRYDFDEQKIK